MKKFSDYRAVRDKAAEIYRNGGVDPIKISPDFSEANVHSVSGQTYYNILRFENSGGSAKITDWTCECPWGKWNYDRAPEYKYLEHRKCAHSLAHLYYLMAFAQRTNPYLDRLEHDQDLVSG